MLNWLHKSILIALLGCWTLGFWTFVLWSSHQQPYQQQDTTESAAQVSHPSSAEERIANYTLAVAWLTGILALSTVGLWYATWKTAKISERALTELERAFVFVKGIDVFIDRDRLSGMPYQYRISVILENSGGSTAIRMAYSFSCSQVAPENIVRFNFPDGDINLGVLGPRATLQTASKRIEPGDIELLTAKETDDKKRWFIWGWVDYDDIFENTPRHRTEFCFEIKARPMASGIPFVSFPMHNRFNATDDDCLRKPKQFPS